jgi:hypothetical protein
MISESLEAALGNRESDFQPLVTAIQTFGVDVWEGGLAKQVEESPSRSMAGTLKGGFCLLTFTLAGRVMLTFQGGGCSVTAMTADKERPCRIGLHGIDGTISQALELIKIVTLAAKADHLQMIADLDVTLNLT